MKRVSVVVVLSLAMLGFLPGCTEALEETEMVAIENVPESVMSVAEEKLPWVKFDTAWIEKDGEETFYEVRGKTADGKTRDIKVSPQGEVMEID